MCIKLLRDCPECVPTLAAWFKAHWPDYFAGRTVQEVAADFRGEMNASDIPVRLVALADGELAGTIVLRERALRSRPDLAPGVGGFFVAPSYRRRGIGAELLRECMALASRLGYRRIYAATITAASIFERLGWMDIGPGEHEGERLFAYDVEETRVTVVAVSRSESHTFSKPNCDTIRLLTGLGVEGDAHCGATVKHRSRVAQDPTQPNLRQIHLMPLEIIHELNRRGFDVARGQMGENITTQGVDLLALPRGATLTIGEAVVEITGLRNPCGQLNGLQNGLMAALLDRAEDGTLIRRAGVMAVVLRGGEVRPGDTIRVSLPPAPHVALDRV